MNVDKSVRLYQAGGWPRGSLTIDTGYSIWQKYEISETVEEMLV